MPVPERNPNHPKKGSSIKVEPIRTKAAIERIKASLLQAGKYRDLCLFTLGINTGFRANEILSITLNQVLGLEVGDTFELKQSKNGKHRRVTVNKTAHQALRLYLENDRALKIQVADSPSKAPLFYSQRGKVLTVPTVTGMVKGWCEGAGLKGNYGSHTMRKTWGWWQYKQGRPLPLLMVAFGHSTQQQTLDYLCIQAKEIEEIYGLEL